MKLKFFNVLQQFKKQIVDGACEQKEPEKFLTSEYIANSFWEFVRNANVAEDEAYYLEWYEEEHGKNAELDKTDFIFSMVLGVQERMDIAEEYLNLCNKEKEYNSAFQEKKSELEAQIREIGNDTRNKKEKDKKIYAKMELERMQKNREKSDKRHLIEIAWRNCIIPYYKKWGMGNSGLSLYSVRNIDTDRSDLIFLGDLPVSRFEEMIQLRAENPERYSDEFEKMIYEQDILEKMEKIVGKNFYIHDRLPIIKDAIMLFKRKRYLSFVYLATAQIEGIFKVLLQEIQGNRTKIRGIKELLEQMRKSEEFSEYVYFAYDFPEYRNKIAHGDMIFVDKKLACEIMMDLYWAIKKIESEDWEYKKILLFLNDFNSKENLKQKVQYLESYSDSIEGKEHLDLLEKYFEGDFEEVLNWYIFDEQAEKFNESIRSEEFYLLIWNNAPLKLKHIEKLTMVDGTEKEFMIIKDNKRPLKYYSLLQLFAKYNFVPVEWYKKYLSFVEKTRLLREDVDEKEEN